MTTRQLVAAILLGACLGSEAEMPAERTGTIEMLAQTPGPHWVWVYDMLYDYMADGRASLLDGDSGRFLGMLSTGYSFTQLTLPRDYHEIYSAETHYSRTARGARTDIVAVYDPRTLAPIAEIAIPPKRGSTIPTLHNVVLTDDDRFLLVFNITPATSVSVVDVRERRFVEEVEAPGCSLIYPAGPRRFFMLCQDGGLLMVDLDDSGHATSKRRSEPFFDPDRDPISEKGVRYGNTWLFASFDSYVHAVDVGGAEPAFAPKWSLVSAAERAGSWRMGGTQHLAVHEASGRLYSIMHQGGPYTRKDPGTQVWVYDLATRERVQIIELNEPAGLVVVTRDDAPLMFTADVPVNAINVYDPRGGSFLRRIDEVGYTPTGMQAPWRP
ncbi:MAG: amine dehydrogenase [Gammaproteobacteria bacterium]|nr:amine dehydrogenase [Gammaproteobacteria bacterium]